MTRRLACLWETGPVLVTTSSGEGRLAVGGFGARVGAGGASLLEVVELVGAGGGADLQERSANTRAEAMIKRAEWLGRRFMVTLR